MGAMRVRVVWSDGPVGVSHVDNQTGGTRDCGCGRWYPHICGQGLASGPPQPYFDDPLSVR